MHAMDHARELAKAIRETEEYREYAALKAEIDADAGIKSLVQEYKRLQTAMQMRMLAGQAMEGNDAQRFQSLNVLLFADQRTANFLMAEMRLQKMMAEIFGVLTQAAGMDIPLPV
jgi:cell fate (sporulation/competence/biofilm development) regulator YlbF (YheA/YmcA/DUF963 family)